MAGVSLNNNMHVSAFSERDGSHGAAGRLTTRTVVER